MADAGAWVVAVPAVLVAAGWCLLPGLLVTLVCGLRGVLALGLAPAVSIATSATGAVVASAAGVPWSPAAALVPAVVLAVLAAAVRLLRTGFRRWRAAAPAPPVAPDGAPVAFAVLAGMVGAVVIGAVAAVNGMGLPAAVSQTYDAVFHYSAVARVLAGGDASSLTLGTLTNPGAETAFYPAAWHGLVSLVVLTTGAAVPVASNAAAVAIAAVVWPVSCLALVRVVMGPSWPALAATPVVAMGFIAYPWSLMSFGVLWPNLIGMSLVPAALAVVIAATGRVPAGSLGRLRAVVLLPVVVVGLGLAHPSAVFSLVVIALFPLAGAVGLLLVRMFRARWRVTALLVGAAVVAVAVLLGDLLLTSPAFDEVRAFDWPAFATPPDAVGDVALGATNNKEPAWVLAVVVLVGAVVAPWRAGHRWLLPAHAATATLYVLAAATESPTTAALTGFWYNDSYRLAAMLPVTGVPLAVLGLLAVGSLVHRVLPTSRVGAGALTATATAAVLVATGGMYTLTHASFVDDAYAAGPGGRYGLLEPAERAFFDEVAALVPPDAVIAQNPWTGSALIWPLTGREVLFPHLAGNWTEDHLVLARSLNAAVDDPAICAAADRSGVTHLVVGTADFWPNDPRSGDYPGLQAPPPDRGFRLLAADESGNALYQLLGCGPITTPPAVPTGP